MMSGEDKNKIKLSTLVSFLNKFLRIEDFGFDSSVNGLQVSGKDYIKRVVVSEDACLDVFNHALEKKADLIIVHHGLFWKNTDFRLTHNNYRRTKFLLENNIALYAAHLPLDYHIKVGNNIMLLKLLNLKPVKRFGLVERVKIGFIGELKKRLKLKDFAKIINRKLLTESLILNFGSETIKKVGVVSGSGSPFVQEAVDNNVDLFLTGDISTWVYHLAKENNMNIIAAGHYATETLGVKALGNFLKRRFGLRVCFVDYPTGL